MEKFYLEINGINSKILKFESENNKKNILILHGWGGKSESWTEFGKLLSKNGFNVFIPDLPGFGETNLPKVFRLEDYADFAKELILKLNLENFYLFGHSNGGAICVKFLNIDKNLSVKKLILNNSAGVRNEKKINFKRKVLKNISLIFKKFKYIPGYEALRINFYKIIGNYDYVNSLKKPFLEETYKNIIGEDLQEEMKNVNIETLLLRGEKDTFTPVSYSKIFNENIKNSKLVVIKNEGHSIHLRNVEKLLKEFLANIN